MMQSISAAHGIILAGGQSRRMGQNKAQLLWQECTFLERAEELLAQIPCNHITMSLAHGAEPPIKKPPISGLVWDSHIGLGPVDGILSVLEKQARKHGEMYLFLPVDMPLLRVEMLRELLHQLQKQPDIDTAYFRGYPLPFCLRYRDEQCARFQEMRRTLAQGSSFSIKDFLQAFTRIECTLDANTISLMHNINTPAHWNALQCGVLTKSPINED